MHGLGVPRSAVLKEASIAHVRLAQHRRRHGKGSSPPDVNGNRQKLTGTLGLAVAFLINILATMPTRS